MKYENLPNRGFLACQVLSRDDRDRDLTDVGPVDVTIRIHGIIYRDDPVSKPSRRVDWEQLVRVLWSQMTPEQRKTARKRLQSPRRMSADITQLVESVTTTTTIVARGALRGNLQVDLEDICQEWDRRLDTVSEIAQEAR